MKKVYTKPYTEKVQFSYQDQVVAASGYYAGGEYNRDDTGKCQQTSFDCNWFWNTKSSRISAFSLEDCTEAHH